MEKEKKQLGRPVGSKNSVESIPLATIQNGLRQLKQRYAKEKSNELLWEIRHYNWILTQPDANAKADLYLCTRYPEHKGEISKRKVVEILGWDLVS